jgi:hypothetical protein
MLVCSANADAATSASTYYFTNNGGTSYLPTEVAGKPVDEGTIRRRIAQEDSHADDLLFERDARAWSARSLSVSVLCAALEARA